MTDKMIGRIFGDRYKIIDRIGIGGMAEVYRAQDMVLGRMVAVKVMLPQYASDPTFTKRFKQEAASAANLQSPYIVNVYDWGQDRGTYFIVMEFVRGSDLKTGIIERGVINQRKVAEIGSQVCQALSVAHGLDIIHRDIKPQNIMVQPDGNVKVMDFGIARAKNSVSARTSSVLGTAHYISPEQAQGKELTAASDIYSLGIVLFEAATGKLPFDGPDAISVATKQVNELPPRPSDIKPDIDPALEAVIVKALQKDPFDRFATAKEMRAALNDYLAGRSVNIDNGFTSAQTQFLGNTPAVITGATTVIPHVPGTDAGSYQLRNGQNGGNDQNGNKPEKKKGKGKTIAIILVLLAIAVAVAFAVTGGFGMDKATVPDVTGKTLEEATTDIEREGFQLGTTSTVYDKEVKAGCVVSQDPNGGTEEERGTRINLSISQGEEQVSVPDVTGKSIEEAQKTLEKAGFTARSGTAEYSDEVDANCVIRQKPKAGSKAAAGSTVEYVPSLGTEDLKVPDVRNYSQSEAINTLNNNGFEANVENEYSDEVGEGMVIRQDPSGGSKVEKGTTVTIVVSLGVDPEKNKTDVPDCTGQTVEVARATLSALGFEVVVKGDDEATAIVSAQKPAGTRLENGGTVTLTAKASEPEPTTDPSTGGGESGEGAGDSSSSSASKDTGSSSSASSGSSKTTSSSSDKKQS